MPTPRTKSRFIAAASLVLALAAFALAWLGWYEIASFGFPDGYRTAYQRAIVTPLKVLNSLYVAIGVCFLWCAARPFAKGSDTLRYVLLVVFAITVMLAEVSMPWYYLKHLGLDHGRGG